MSVLVQEQHVAGACQWDVQLCERLPATVDVASEALWVGVRLTDGEPGEVAPPCTMARLGGDGTVTLRTHRTPPALLFSRAGGRLIPTIPGVEDITMMTEDDLLILCSADVLEQLPAGFRSLIEGGYPASPRGVATALGDLMADVDGGAVVAVRRVAAATSTEQGDPR